jgi:hypothetical protein
MNTHVFIVVERPPGWVHGENLVIRELTPEQKTSIKFAKITKTIKAKTNTPNKI